MNISWRRRPYGQSGKYVKKRVCIGYRRERLRLPYAELLKPYGQNLFATMFVRMWENTNQFVRGCVFPVT